MVGTARKNENSAAALRVSLCCIPPIIEAAVYKLYKYYKEAGGFTNEDLKLLGIGNLVAFIVAMVAIKFFIGFLKKHGFRIWGIYRIVLGLILFALIYTGHIKS